MKVSKIFGVAFIMLFASVIVAGNFKGAKAPADKPQTPYFIMQESASVDGSTVKAYSGSDSLWLVRDRAYTRTYAKAIKVTHGATAGIIYLHLTDNPAGVYDKYYLSPDDKEGVCFDAILKTGTTIDLDSIQVLL